MAQPGDETPYRRLVSAVHLTVVSTLRHNVLSLEPSLVLAVLRTSSLWICGSDGLPAVGGGGGCAGGSAAREKGGKDSSFLMPIEIPHI